MSPTSGRLTAGEAIVLPKMAAIEHGRGDQLQPMNFLLERVEMG
jgi:hypothetical protein